MKYDADPIGRDVSGRTALRESSEKVSGHHLNEIRERLLLEPRALNEATIAWALEIHPFLSATRGIARWTGAHKETVQQIAGPTGGTSDFKFLYTASRGRSSVIEEEREDMQLRFNSLAGRSWTPLGPSGYRHYAAQYLSEVPIPSGAWAERILEEKDSQRSNGREIAGIREELVNDLVKTSEEFEKLEGWDLDWSRTLLRILDPADDQWAEEGDYAWGKQAWRLAVLFGARDIFVTAKDLEALLGLKERQVRNLLNRWTEGLALAVEEKVGRTKIYTLMFHSILHPDGMAYLGYTGRKNRMFAAMQRDTKERATAARRGTPEGAIAWKAANPRTRQAFLDDLPEDADPVWRELVERGGELEMHDHLVAQAKEAGPVPSTPEVLVEEAAVQPAQESMEAPKPIDPEVLAAMRYRISAQERTPAARQPEVVPTAHQLHETPLMPHPDPEALAAMRRRISRQG
ncbi:hypothetical protein OH738_10675 [Streptomyces hirsutus]|uniref:Uncharacterized protein n=1 Tax=Streptomyces hirsutus TaxID=35620 RepID=A0ABZ1GVK5_9ACTN|nr:hypothetical protein [Streptomyces hirsutus]WSD09347.1 hypothetical protein OIE73_28800 [Streptomyces hirsutus]WTD17203.1 hypothetical protein OH738_10675 [Streptomyces hirsutus]